MPGIHSKINGHAKSQESAVNNKKDDQLIETRARPTQIIE
jgi:hypothetical protein